jgi:hypothetical protein
MARKPSKTIKQPDQYEMSFAHRMWAQDADLNHIGLIAVTVAAAGFGALFAVDDFLLLPALATLLLLAFSVLAVCIHSMRLKDRKGFFVAAHLVTITGIFLVLGYSALDRSARHRAFGDAVAEQKMKAEQLAEQMKKAEQLKELNTKRAAEARAAAAAREQECKDAVTAAISIAERHKSDAYAALIRCRRNFERDRLIFDYLFTNKTAQTHCQARGAEWAAANKDLEAAKQLVCAPTDTGSIDTRKNP